MIRYPNKITTPTARASLVALAFAGLLALVGACDLPESFGPEYYDSSINYIDAFPLSAPGPDLDSLNRSDLNLSAAWDWGWRGIMDNTYAYMTLTQDTVSDAPPGGGSVWSLGLANLFRNGTFETAPESGDLAPSTAEAFWSKETALADPIHGSGLWLETKADNGQIDFIMPNLLQDTPSDDFEYFIRFMVDREISDFVYTAGPTESRTSSSNKSVVINDFLSGFGTGNFSFGPAIINPLTVDEVRVVRADEKDSMYLRLLLAPRDTYPTLVPGYFEFSVWVKTPDDAYRFDDHTNRNIVPDAPYAVPTVTLGIRQLAGTDGAMGGGSATFPVPANWSQLKLRLPVGSNLQRFDESSDTSVIELYMVPGDTATPDAGALLIADPSLNFYINNY
ncbi:MAG: hypothetical protein ABIJ86_16390 [Spirochaetota bacterium]